MRCEFWIPFLGYLRQRGVGLRWKARCEFGVAVLVGWDRRFKVRATSALDRSGVATMRDVVDGGGYLSVCKCCRCNIGSAGNVEFCEPCLQVVKQCPPKKRFMRAGCMKPRPIIVKPASSIALDRLVEVALSPTDLDGTKSFDFASTSKQLPKVGLAGHGPGTPSGENGVARSDCEGSAVGSPICKRRPPKQALVASSEDRLPSFSLPLEAVQKLKRLSTLDELPQPRSSKVVHGDHSKRFTPRFKSLLDISC